MVPKHLDKMHSIILVIWILQQLTKLQSFFVICTAKKYAVLSTTYEKKKTLNEIGGWKQEIINTDEI